MDRHRITSMPGVIVLHALLPPHADAPRVDAWLRRLPYGRQLEIERRPPRDRLASIIGIELAIAGAECLGAVGADVSRLRFPQDGKPRFETGPPFSISHTATRVAVAVCRDFEVGLDAEDLDEATATDGIRLRLRRWTATEACLKVMGVGLRRAADVRLSARLECATLDGTAVHLRPVALGPGTICHVATLAPVAGISVREVRS
jgi:hypothetical protein